ncbi:MAG: hypothetical protein HQL56_15440 [Magnetococcales bacterium]|nr:hypothetical protein [Magnetococcales bacterium]
MSCNPELVSAFLDGELEKIIMGRVVNHLTRCDACCRTLSRLAAVRDAVSGHFALPNGEALTHSVMVAISNEQISYGAAQESVLHQRLVRFGLPAALAAALIGGWLSSQPDSKTVLGEAVVVQGR